MPGYKPNLLYFMERLFRTMKPIAFQQHPRSVARAPHHTEQHHPAAVPASQRKNRLHKK